MLAPAESYASSAAPSEGDARAALRALPARQLHARVRLRVPTYWRSPAAIHRLYPTALVPTAERAPKG
jgi:hypothetical protein